MKLKKKFLSTSGVLAVLVAGFSYIYVSDHTGVVELPAAITPIDQGITNAYLVKTQSGYLLFDTGYEKDFDSFTSTIGKLGIRIDQIRYLLLSHHHDDHAGYVSRLLDAQPALTVIVHETMVPLLASGKNNTANGGGIVNLPIYALFRIKRLLTPDWTLTFPPYAVRPQDIVLRGSRSQLASEMGLNAAVIHTPGHSSDSISLLVGDYLLCGDFASYFLNWAGARHLTLFNENVAQVYASWRAALALDVKYIVPAHGKPFRAESLRQNLDALTQAELVRFF